jgi:hypothetical protein
MLVDMAALAVSLEFLRPAVVVAPRRPFCCSPPSIRPLSPP